MTAHLGHMTSSTEPVRGDLLATAERTRAMGDRRMFVNDEGHMKGPRRAADLGAAADDVTEVLAPGDLTRRASQYLCRLRRLDHRRKGF